MMTGAVSVTGAGSAVRRRTFGAFGTVVELASCAGSTRSLDEVEAHLTDLHTRFSRFIKGSELDAFNESSGRWVEVSGQMARLLRHALQVAVESRGLVNVAVTNALLAEGYVHSWPAPWQPSGRAQDAGGVIPPLTELLELRSHQARLAPGHRIDFGGIAKGLWADDAVEMLGPNAAASLGGDISARGHGPDAEGWPVGIPNGRTLLVVDGGVATSGTSKRRSGHAHHVIDPRTGRSAQLDVIDLTVLARSASAAEWLATAALLAGDDADELLARHGARQWTVRQTAHERSAS